MESTEISKRKAQPEQLNKIRYRRFKETANLLLKYETEEDKKDKQEITREHKCPTCKEKWANKAQLTCRRKKSKSRQAEYWSEQKEPKNVQTAEKSTGQKRHRETYKIPLREQGRLGRGKFQGKRKMGK